MRDRQQPAKCCELCHQWNTGALPEHAKGEKADTEATLAEDEKYLAELRQMCKTKTEEFESRQGLRQGELDAIGKAVEILSGGSVAGAADKHLPGLMQKGTSFAQVSNAAVSPLQTRVAAFLKERASKVNSPILSLMATRTGDDPFTKVKKMIKEDAFWKLPP